MVPAEEIVDYVSNNLGTIGVLTGFYGGYMIGALAAGNGMAKRRYRKNDWDLEAIEEEMNRNDEIITETYGMANPVNFYRQGKTVGYQEIIDQLEQESEGFSNQSKPLTAEDIDRIKEENS